MTTLSPVWTGLAQADIYAEHPGCLCTVMGIHPAPVRENPELQHATCNTIPFQGVRTDIMIMCPEISKMIHSELLERVIFEGENWKKNQNLWGFQKKWQITQKLGWRNPNFYVRKQGHQALPDSPRANALPAVTNRVRCWPRRQGLKWERRLESYRNNFLGTYQVFCIVNYDNSSHICWVKSQGLLTPTVIWVK